MIAMPLNPDGKPKRRRWDLSWVVAVTRNRVRVIYACVPAVDSARVLLRCAVDRGYRDATVERMDVYMAKHGSQSAKDYLAAMEPGGTAGTEEDEQVERDARPAILPVLEARGPTAPQKYLAEVADYQRRGCKRR
jgi:hypothetical protein